MLESDCEHEMIHNFKLTIEYDGSCYCGWQRQKSEPTIQEEIEKALNKMTGQTISLKGSGRTDAGVHAYGQVANFSCNTSLTADVFLKGLNSLLPKDIVIKGCENVSEDFHARYSAKQKTYAYRILNRTLPCAIGRQYAWHIRTRLDNDAMKRALQHVVGTHDFKAFEGAGSPRTHTIRTVESVEIYRKDSDSLIFEITADGFLRFMIRNVVGTLVEVGTGKCTPDGFYRILQSRDRNQAGVTAPPHGLFLMRVEY
jgi:tRNA pseudouridine38-40 synthase